MNVLSQKEGVDLLNRLEPVTSSKCRNKLRWVRYSSSTIKQQSGCSSQLQLSMQNLIVEVNPIIMGVGLVDLKSRSPRNRTSSLEGKLN